MLIQTSEGGTGGGAAAEAGGESSSVECLLSFTSLPLLLGGLHSFVGGLKVPLQFLVLVVQLSELLLQSLELLNLK
jgi:hypothetical protein